MTNIAALPALALIIGAAAGVYAPLPLAVFVACAVIGWGALTIALMAPRVTPAAAGMSAGEGGSSRGAAAWIARVASVAAIVGYFGAGAALAAVAIREALEPPILADSHARRVDVAGAAEAVPIVLSGTIRSDASATEFGAMFTMAADTIRMNFDGGDRATAGTVRIAVGGTSAARHIDEWRAGRRVRVTATLAAPLPYLNIGTTNQETRLALAGIRLFGSVKSASQVELLARGPWWDEAAASVRAFVRHAVATHVKNRAAHLPDVAPTLAPDENGPPAVRAHGHALDAVDTEGSGAGARTGTEMGLGAAIATAIPISTRGGDAATIVESAGKASAASGKGEPPQNTRRSASTGDVAANAAGAANSVGAAIATAILIGDRAGLDHEVEERLQRAGTFHVIAISGGNIAILTALILGLLHLVGAPPRASAWLTIAAVGLYAFIVGSGTSVARASLAAIVYLFARAIDHRTPPLNVLAVVIAIMLVWAPLEIVDAGFWLTCLATLAIMLLAQRMADRAGKVLRRIAAKAAALPDSQWTPGSPPLVTSSTGEWFGALSARLASIYVRISKRVYSARGSPVSADARLGLVTPGSPDTSGMRGGSRVSRQARKRLSGWRVSGARVGGWLVNRAAESAIGLLAATVAAEAVLLPVTAYAFSQVSIAGLALNFVAIPLMTVVQIAGIAIVLCAHGVAPIADFAGVIADVAARGIVASSLIVDSAPWSAPRVAPPPLWLLLACQASLCAAWFGRPPPWRRRIGACAWLTCLGLVVCALPLPSFSLRAVGSDECQMADEERHSDRWLAEALSAAASNQLNQLNEHGSALGAESGFPSERMRPTRRLRVTFLDVAQGDATLIRFPDGRAWLVDTGGALGRFDIGTRIVSPALWALGLRRLSTLVLTHGDRDHIGGAHAMLRDFRPEEVWEGVPVDGHAEMTRLRSDASERHIRWRTVRSDEQIVAGAGRADDHAGRYEEAVMRASYADRAKRIADRAPVGDENRSRDRKRGEATDGSRQSHGNRAGTGAGTHSGTLAANRAEDAVDIRVWHPSAPTFIRRRVRNDDSIVLELAFGNVSVILPGDIGPAVERVLAAQHAPPSQLVAIRPSPAVPTLASRVPAVSVMPSSAPASAPLSPEASTSPFPSPLAPALSTPSLSALASRVPAVSLVPSSAPASGSSSPEASASPFVSLPAPALRPPAASARVTTVNAAMQASLSPERLPEASPGPLRVLKVPHHGSKSSSTAAFLDALQPRLAIVSAGRGNRHGHPAPAVLARYAARGTEVFRTDQDGAIQLDTDGHTMTVRTCSGRRLSLTADGSNASSLLARGHD